MSDTIFYEIKLKRTKTPMEVFEKMQRSVGKKGPAKNWVCTVDRENECMVIDFSDGESENFTLAFENRVCNDFCKVYFPLEGELFEDEKKSEFKALLNMIYSARTAFSEMKITDDYGLAESFLDSKVNKIALRELTHEENDRARRLYDDGHREYKDFIMALLYDYRELPYEKDYSRFVNKNVSCSCFDLRNKKYLPPFIESFLYETAEYRDEGRLYRIRDYFSELNGVWFSVYAFLIGIEQLIHYFEYEKGWDPKSTQVLRLYRGKLLPLFEREENEFGKCVLAYRFFVSIYDYLGFRYVGRAIN